MSAGAREEGPEGQLDAVGLHGCALKGRPGHYHTGRDKAIPSQNSGAPVNARKYRYVQETARSGLNGAEASARGLKRTDCRAI